VRSFREIGLVVAGLLAFAVLGAACDSGKARAIPTTSTSRPTTTTRAKPVHRTTTTTVWKATAPQLSADAAAELLVSKWSAGDRAGAGAVASPGAVTALFSQTYPAGDLQFRGCTQGANPATCTYRNLLTDGIYEFGVIEAPDGWYVSSVTPET
jgi:hypothetical protein